MTGRYKRLLRYTAAFAAILSLTFIIPRLMPGDPVINILGEDLSFSPRQLDDLREEMGLNDSLGKQYLRYWGRVLSLDLGYSYHFNRAVSDIIGERIKWTLLFIIPSIIIGAAAGALLGALSGWYDGKIKNKIATSVMLTFYSVPPFFLAILFLYFFSFRLGLFPLKGYYTTGAPMDILRHLTLPVAVLSLFTTARNYMIMRGSVIQEKSKLYPLYAKAKGLGKSQVLKRHVFWNASLPLITLIALDFGFIFSGALFVEIVFSMNGMGTLIYEAVGQLDYPVLQGAFLIISVMIIAANIIADILYSLIDPRTRARS